MISLSKYSTRAIQFQLQRVAPVDKHQPDILWAQHHSNALVVAVGSSGDGIEEALHLRWPCWHRIWRDLQRMEGEKKTNHKCGDTWGYHGNM